MAIADRFGREAQLVRAGSGAEIAGLGLDVLHRDQIDAVVGLYPRHNLKRQIDGPLSQEARERPCCRIAFMQRKLGFSALIQGAPMFAE